MGRSLSGKTLLKKYRSGELELSEFSNGDLILLIEEQGKEIFKANEDIQYIVNQENKSQYKMASQTRIKLSTQSTSDVLSPVEVLTEIFNTLMRYKDEGLKGVDIKRPNYRFIYKN